MSEVLIPLVVTIAICAVIGCFAFLLIREKLNLNLAPKEESREAIAAREARARALLARLDALGFPEVTPQRREGTRGALAVVLEPAWTARIVGTRRWLPAGVDEIAALSGYSQADSYKGALSSGDREFDSKFLVYTDDPQAAHLSPEWMARLRSHRVEGMRIETQQLTVWLRPDDEGRDEEQQLVTMLELAELLERGT